MYSNITRMYPYVTHGMYSYMTLSARILLVSTRLYSYVTRMYSCDVLVMIITYCFDILILTWVFVLWRFKATDALLGNPLGPTYSMKRLANRTQSNSQNSIDFNLIFPLRETITERSIVLDWLDVSLSANVFDCKTQSKSIQRLRLVGTFFNYLQYYCTHNNIQYTITLLTLLY